MIINFGGEVRGCPSIGVLLLALTGGCNAGPTDPVLLESGLQVGGVGFYYADLPHISLPERVAPGEPFELVVDTWGNACVSLGPDRVELVSLGARVTPYDRYSEGLCDDILLRFQHRVSLTLTTVGTNQITVLAREKPDGGVERFTRDVQVR